MKQYVYQLSVRKPDHEKKKFIIETDTVYSEKKLNQESAEEISKKYFCDVMLLYLGELKPEKIEQEPIKSEYYTKKQIVKIIEKWEKESSENGSQDLQPVQ